MQRPRLLVIHAQQACVPSLKEAGKWLHTPSEKASTLAVVLQSKFKVPEMEHNNYSVIGPQRYSRSTLGDVPVHWESRLRLKKSVANVQKMRPRRVMSAVVESRLRLEKSRLHSIIFRLYDLSNG